MLNEYINAEQYSDALNFMTTNITLENLVEENLFYTMKLQLEKTIAEIDTLMNIAYTSPSEGGAGVHIARAMLGLEVNDPKLMLRMAAPLQSENKEKVLVYPNPTKGILQLNGIGEDSKIELQDASNRVIMKLNNMNSVNLAPLENGFYFLKICTPNGKTTYKSVILNK